MRLRMKPVAARPAMWRVMILAACLAGFAPAGLGSAGSDQSRSQGLEWHEFEKALALGKKQGRMVVVDFYTDWCGWCKRMDKDTYANVQVIKYAKERLVMSKVNAESQALTRFKDQQLSYQQLAQSLGVRGYPATIFIDAQGELLTLLPGYHPPDQFLAILEFLAEGHYKSMKFEQYLAKRKS